MNDYEEDTFLEALISAGTDEDWTDFWADEDPTEHLMNDKKLEGLNA